MRERTETEAKLQRAEQHVRLVEDRERIARDLHDTVIQKLFAAGMTLQGVCARTTDTGHERRLSNVARHAEATRVELVVECGERVTLRVTDNGRGMPVEPTSGNGLVNLADRAARLGGHCDVSYRPDGGTVVEWQVPNRG